MTSDLPGRIYKHREGLIPGFTRQYGVKILVWFEQHATMEQAILREKRIKKAEPRLETAADRGD